MPASAPAKPADAKTAEPLKVGVSHERVGHLQNRLNSLGAGLKVDGVFGPKTHAEIASRQQQWGLAADGVVGPKTTEALRTPPADTGADKKGGKAAPGKGSGADTGADKKPSNRFVRKIEIDDRGTVRVLYRPGSEPAPAAAGAVAEALEEAARGGMVKCPNCETLNAKSAKTCKNCGKALGRVTAKAKRDDRTNVSEAEEGKPGPNWKQVGPHARKKLSGLIRHYMKMAHPFTACVRDNRKRFGSNAEKVCAVVKDLGHGGTGWRKGGRKGAISEAEVNQAVERFLYRLYEAGMQSAEAVDLLEAYMIDELPPERLWIREDMAELAEAEATKVCPACHTLNMASAGSCIHCGSSLDGVAKAPYPELDEARRAGGRAAQRPFELAESARGGASKLLKRLPDGTFAPKGRGQILRRGQKVRVPRRDGPGNAKGHVVSHDLGTNTARVKLADGPDAGKEFTVKAEGMPSSSVAAARKYRNYEPPRPVRNADPSDIRGGDHVELPDDEIFHGRHLRVDHISGDRVSLLDHESGNLISRSRSELDAQGMRRVAPPKHPGHAKKISGPRPPAPGAKPSPEGIPAISQRGIDRERAKLARDPTRASSVADFATREAHARDNNQATRQAWQDLANEAAGSPRLHPDQDGIAGPPPGETSASAPRPSRGDRQRKRVGLPLRGMDRQPMRPSVEEEDELRARGEDPNDSKALERLRASKGTSSPARRSSSEQRVANLKRGEAVEANGVKVKRTGETAWSVEGRGRRETVLSARAASEALDKPGGAASSPVPVSGSGNQRRASGLYNGRQAELYFDRSLNSWVIGTYDRPGQAASAKTPFPNFEAAHRLLKAA